MTPTRLRWECPDKDRYYETHLARDLLGDWVLTRVWGRRGTSRGRVQHTLCTSRADAHTMLAAVARRRRSRGYIPIATH